MQNLSDSLPLKLQVQADLQINFYEETYELKSKLVIYIISTSTPIFYFTVSK
jgi:hypothetical protein